MTLRIIAGKWKGRLLKTPANTSTRPTQGILRGAVFNICQNIIEGASFLDIYAGSGAMAFEALSRGAAHATLIEKNRTALRCIHTNIESLNAQSQTQVLPLDALASIKRLNRTFDIIYIDPPYDTPLKPLIDAILTTHILNPEALLFIEERNTRSSPPDLSPFQLKDSRRFGIALLHQYQIQTV